MNYLSNARSGGRRPYGTHDPPPQVAACRTQTPKPGMEHFTRTLCACISTKEEMEEAITGKTNEFVAGENRRVRECAVP